MKILNFECSYFCCKLSLVDKCSQCFLQNAWGLFYRSPFWNPNGLVCGQRSAQQPMCLVLLFPSYTATYKEKKNPFKMFSAREHLKYSWNVIEIHFACYWWLKTRIIWWFFCISREPKKKKSLNFHINKCLPIWIKY